MRIGLRRALAIVRRFSWLVVLVAIVTAVAWMRLWSAVPANAVRVDRGTIVEHAFGRGTVETQREAAVGFDLVGRLSDVLVDEGARVTLGQELARLETDQAKADLQTANTGIAAARASLKRLAAEEARARALLVTADREAARTRTLLQSGAVPGKEADDADDRVRVARADLDRVLAQRAEATRGIDVASGGAEQRRVAMVRATLLAPFDGLVTRRLREPGDTVTVGTTVLRIVDTTSVYVNAAIDETVLPRLAVGLPSTITFPGTTAPITGKVSRIAWEADRQTHEIVVEVTPDQLDRRVAIGQRADVQIELARRDRVLRVPIEMVHHDSAGAFLYTDRDGRIAVVRPRLGATGATHVEILDGLADGDLVLAAGKAAAPLPVGRRWKASP
ncbi:MAG TPA: efflux RND transporter periplasmic adaptor subunit [Kofleriaceae bacterium]|nr:efflux RND transporter periplasmic adaptor subunit [Kofleriaceae bacterium]